MRPQPPLRLQDLARLRLRLLAPPLGSAELPGQVLGSLGAGPAVQLLEEREGIAALPAPPTPPEPQPRLDRNAAPAPAGVAGFVAGFDAAVWPLGELIPGLLKERGEGHVRPAGRSARPVRPPILAARQAGLLPACDLERDVLSRWQLR